MSTYTVELSEYQGTAGASNGEWTNTFQNKISLEDGDVLQIKQALVNSQTASADSITIAEDTVIGITCGFYDNPVLLTNGSFSMIDSAMQTGDDQPA